MQDNPTQSDQFRKEWVRWQPRIYAYIRSVVFHRADAEDLLQEVAEVLWRKVDAVPVDASFEQWAFGVARNKVLNFQKKKGRERVRFSEAFEQALAEEAARHAESSADILDALEACVAKLPEHQRELLRQRYEPDATGRSVAQALGRSESAVSRMLNAVYALLLSCIENSTGA
jgi:RNA polymerase sigma-70 factor (ECF subfamily)